MNMESTKSNYLLVRRAQASITSYCHFGEKHLSTYLDRPAFQELAQELAQKYFHKSMSNAVFPEIVDVYAAYLVISPLLQRLPLSMRMDWDAANVLSWFRINCGGRRARIHYSETEVRREFAPDVFQEAIRSLNLYDECFVEFLYDLYRRSYAQTTVRGQLTNALLDPLLLHHQREGYSLRVGNKLYRLEKNKFPGSASICETPLMIGSYNLRFIRRTSGSHMEILISDHALTWLRSQIKDILACTAIPKYKIKLIEHVIRDFIETTRFARSAKHQVLDLKQWLAQKVRPLSGTDREALTLPNQLVTLWLHRVDHRLHLRQPNFYLFPQLPEKSVYMAYYSPYREAM